MKRRLVLILFLLPALCLSGKAFAQAPELVVPTGHDSIWAVAISPDSRLLATGGNENTVKLWDAEHGRELRTLAGLGESVHTLAFSPKGTALAAGVVGGFVVIWDVASGKEVVRLPGGFAIDWSPDGTVLAAKGAGTTEDSIRLWDTGTWREIRALSGHTEKVWSVAWRPDGKVLTSVGDDRTMRMWDPASGREIRVIDTRVASMTSVAWRPDGKVLATANLFSQVLLLWKGDTGEALGILEGGSSPLAWSPDGKVLGCALDGSFALLDGQTGRLIRAVEGDITSAQAAFSPNGRYLAVGTKLLDPATGKVLQTLKAHAATLTSLAWSPDGRYLAKSSWGRHEADVRAWDLSTGRDACFFDLSGQAAWSVSFNPDSRQMAAVVGQESIRLWDVEAGREMAKLHVHSSLVNAVAWDPSGTILADGSRDSTMVLWDPHSGKALRTIRQNMVDFIAPAFSPDGKILACGTGDMGGLAPENNRVDLWEAATGRKVGSLGHHAWQVNAVAWSPDGKILASGSKDTTVKLWDIRTRKEIRTLSGHSGAVSSLSWSPDGRRLASGSDDMTVVVWDVPSGKPFQILRGHSNIVTAAAFHPDGKILASSSFDGRIVLWEAESGRELASIVSIDGKDWIAASPEGFFDGTPAAIGKVLWRLNGNTFDTAEPEQFFSEFFQPGLLKDVVSRARSVQEILKERGDARASLSIARKDRRLPRVSIDAPAGSAERLLRVRVHVEEALMEAGGTPSGIRDVRLFRNGTLATRWPGLHKPGVLEAVIPIAAGENLLEAYAFNGDNVKSKTADARVTGAPSLERAPEAYILSVGINRYADRSMDLTYAAPDARDLSTELAKRLPFPPGSVHTQVLLDGEASRPAILAALADVAKKAQTEDTVIVSYSGHGVLHGGHFYLIPHEAAAAEDMEELTRRAIGDDDLESAFLGMQARNIALVLDACHSGQALESDDWRRGPMNSRGLVQLAWEKGMEVLAASQSRQAALEARKAGNLEIGHGLLTYCLIEAFSRAPRVDRRLSARDWLDYAASRVPRLLRGEQKGQRGVHLLAPEGSSVQTPRVFHGREAHDDWTVSGVL